MDIEKFLAEQNLVRLINLPEGLRKKIFASNKLSRDEKFIMANLYLLDAYKKIDRHMELLPAMTNMRPDEIKKNLQTLARNKLIVYNQQQIKIKTRPMDYQQCLPEKTSKK